MNFLAHIFLSYPSEPLMFGNFIADYVKGNAYKSYPQTIQQGIIMHRKIDAFTDQHYMVKKSISRIRDAQGKYSPVVIDMFYDHFLAANWSDFHIALPLPKFCEEVYQHFKKRAKYFPTKVKTFFPYMVKYNWLLSYAQIEGIENSLIGLSKRTSYKSNMSEATNVLMQYYEELKQDFYFFLPEIQAYCKSLI
ncbi:MAG: ACP phosphodiesterase [Bacteroidota bacterium]